MFRELICLGSRTHFLILGSRLLRCGGLGDEMGHDKIGLDLHMLTIFRHDETEQSVAITLSPQFIFRHVIKFSTGKIGLCSFCFLMLVLTLATLLMDAFSKLLSCI